MTQSEFRLNRKTLFGMMVLAAAGAMPVHAATINVTTAADAIVDDGFCSLREAVIAANTNSPYMGCVAGESVVVDQIVLPAGTYTLSIVGLDETAEAVVDSSNPGEASIVANAAIGDLDITESVSIVGAGSGTTIIEWDTTVDRDRIFHIYAPASMVDVNVSISGITLTQGRTDEAYLGVGPGSIYGSDPTSYYLRRAGGALAVGPAAAVVLVDPNRTGQENSEGRGGSQRPDDHEEGASYALTLNDVVVDGNYAEGDGGGIYTAAAMTATNIVVKNNESTVNGGGIYNEGNTSVTNSTISGNVGEGGGGMFLTGSNTVTITGSTLNGNRAVGGGAISGRSSVVINMLNSTISGNLARDVGAGFYTNGQASLRFVTIADNIAGADSATAGAGINTFNSGSIVTTVRNVLLSNNKKGWTYTNDDDYKTVTIPLPSVVPSIANCGLTGTGTPDIQSYGYNLSSDTTCATVLNQSTDKNNMDAKLGTLANNGGDTFTHALLAGSPALGAGGAELGVTIDQRGVTRDTPPDIGAYEEPGTTTGGGGGGGCAIGGNARLDPTLPAMLAAALAFFGLRRRAGK